MNRAKQLSRKLLPLMGNIGCFGALTYTIYYTLYADTVNLWMAFCFVMMLSGSVTGFLLAEKDRSKGLDIVRYSDDKVRVILQPTYLYAIIPFVLLFTIGLAFNYGFAGSLFGFALVPAFYFILGIGNGIFDYAQIADRKMLYLAVIPIALSLIIAFISGPYGFYKDPIWIYGSIYLLFFLFVINRLKIEEMFVRSKNVNIENKRQIRRRNDFLIMVFYVLYLIIFVTRNMFTKMSDWILRTMFAFINWFINIFSGLFKQIEPDYTSTEVAGSTEYIEQIEPPVNPAAQTILIILGSITAAMLLYVLIKNIIKLIKWLADKAKGVASSGRKEIVKETDNEEFEEIVEFLHDKKAGTGFKRTPKYKYVLSRLKDIESYSEKVRYLYGFALERLKHKKVEISKADTPEQIYEKLIQQDIGDENLDSVFSEFTDEYIYVRYGGEYAQDDESLYKKGNILDKGIESIKPKKEEKKTDFDSRFKDGF